MDESKYTKSKRLFERARGVIPGGINSNVRAASEPVPLFFARGEGAHVWDADGNEYIDYLLGHGPMILGHSPDTVIEAAKAQLDKGLVFGTGTEIEIRVAELICQHVPCAEMVRFSVTGSEAVHAALRLARAATGRKLILRFEGHYHGWFDNIAWNQAKPGVDLGPREAPPMRPASLGQQPEDGANLVVLPWNDLALVQQLFDTRGDEMAGVICDPFASAAGLIPGQPEFLQGLRDLCTARGSILIFDEVITGFRVVLGGAQAYYGITPDLATFAKAMGAGMPVSALAGKADLMRFFGELTTVHAGTYNAHPVAMAGTLAALDLLCADKGVELAKAHRAGRMLMNGLAEAAHDAGIHLVLRGVPTVFSATFPSIGSEPVVDYRDARQTNTELGRRFWLALQERGVQITSMGIWFVSTAHTDDDIARTLDVARAVLKELV